MPGQQGKLGRVRVTVRARALDRDLRGVVAAKERGVHHDPAYHAWASEPHDRVVVPGVTAAPGLPAVVDLALVAERAGCEPRRFGLDQVLLLGEELVVGVDDAAAERPGREIGQAREVRAGRLAHLRPRPGGQQAAGW